MAIKSLIYPILFFMAIEMAMFLFNGDTGGLVDNSLFALIMNPTGFENATFWLKIQAFILLFGGASLIVGTFFNRFYEGLWVGLGAFLLTFFASIFKLWQFIYGALQGTTASANIIATLICAPIMVAYIFSILSFMRGVE